MVKNCSVLYDEKFLKAYPLATTLNTSSVITSSGSSL